MDAPLSDVEVRVLGSLIEKEHTTPDNYPLSLNALTNACNQSSNRDPVMSLTESTVGAALHQLRGRALVRPIVHSGGRVTKYEHHIGEALGLIRRQVAVLSVLMLRGPQTVGELRTRAQRIHDFADLDDVESTLGALIEREPPLVVRLPRRPGQKETRYAHLLAGEPSLDAGYDRESGEDVAPVPRSSDRIAALEETVATLKQEMAELRDELATFRKQFE